MTTRTDHEINAAIALLNAITAHLKKLDPTPGRAIILGDILEVASGLVNVQNRMAHLERENARLQKVNEQPVTFSTQNMIAAIEKEVAEAANA